MSKNVLWISCDGKLSGHYDDRKDQDVLIRWQGTVVQRWSGKEKPSLEHMDMIMLQLIHKYDSFVNELNDTNFLIHHPHVVFKSEE